jgi:hypothetical protein
MARSQAIDDLTSVKSGLSLIPLVGSELSAAVDVAIKLHEVLEVSLYLAVFDIRVTFFLTKFRLQKKKMKSQDILCKMLRVCWRM